MTTICLHIFKHNLRSLTWFKDAWTGIIGTDKDDLDVDRARIGNSDVPRVADKAMFHAIGISSRFGDLPIIIDGVKSKVVIFLAEFLKSVLSPAKPFS